MILKMTLKWIAVLGFVLLAAGVSAQQTLVLETEEDEVNYGIGVEVVRSFKAQGMDVNLEIVIQGMKDALSEGELLVPEQQLRKTMNAYQIDLRRKQKLARSRAAVETGKAGEAFLAENRNKEGVVALPSGLQYKVLKPGDGATPKDSDMVECHYRGTFIDGTEFDDTHSTGQPATFKVEEGAGIAGWTEAVKLMPVGSKWQLFVPPHLAFGERGAGRGIGPNTTLIFELELRAVK